MTPAKRKLQELLPKDPDLSAHRGAEVPGSSVAKTDLARKRKAVRLACESAIPSHLEWMSARRRLTGRARL